mmetsp:Transcript_6769/g.12802  ORF Transcript_6769/g.12802 Transcript_6769/m.12802 type:complete len:161 (-) Transcript_6769:173-655(-)
MTTPLPRLAPAALVAEAAWQLLWCGVFLFAKSLVLDNLGQTPAASAARRHGVGGAEKALDAEKAAAVARRSAFTLYFVDMCGISFGVRAVLCFGISAWGSAELVRWVLLVMALYNILPFVLVHKYGDALFVDDTNRRISLRICVAEGAACGIAWALSMQQ